MTTSRSKHRHLFFATKNKFKQLLTEPVYRMSDPDDPAYDKKKAVATLLHHVAYANPAFVSAILTINPELLLETGDTEAPSGDMIVNVTAY